MNELRIYNQWAGNLKGRPEDVTRCIVSIWSDQFVPGGYQCSRKRGHGKDGLYCKQHAMQEWRT